MDLTVLHTKQTEYFSSGQRSLLFLKNSLIFFLSLFFCLFTTSSVQALSEKKENIAPFIVFSPPKTGTHLVGKCMELMTEKEAVYCLTGLGNSDEEVIALVERVTSNNGFVVAHNFTLNQLVLLGELGYRIIFTLRDPRDQLVSMFDWFREGQWSWLSVSQIADPDEQIREMITGKKYRWRAFDHCILRRLLMLHHLPKDQCTIVRFELLIGPEGQGSNSHQLQEIQQIALLINIKLTNDTAQNIANRLFGNTPTFRLGQIGRWREYFNDAHISLYKLHYGQILISLGYEQDIYW